MLLELARAERRRRERQTCRLDRAREGFGNRNDATTDSIRVYARFAEGKIERLRALSATCPVKAETEIRDLGAVPADDSARWLASRREGRGGRMR